MHIVSVSFFQLLADCFQEPYYVAHIPVFVFHSHVDDAAIIRNAVKFSMVQIFAKWCKVNIKSILQFFTLYHLSQFIRFRTGKAKNNAAALFFAFLLSPVFVQGTAQIAYTCIVSVFENILPASSITYPACRSLRPEEPA